MLSLKFWKAALTGFFLLTALQPSFSYANAVYNVNFDTSSLTGNSLAPFTLDFILLDGRGTGNANNTVTIRNFNFGAAPVSLTDSSYFNEAQVKFVPSGNSLSFQIDMTTNMESSGITPDSFTFAILDNLLNPIPTLGQNMADNLLAIDIDSSTGTLTTAGTDLSRTTLQINSPTITTVPEPSTFLLISLSLGGVAIVRRMKRS